MKNNIITLTVLMALSATAQATDSAHTLHINGKVNTDSCVFEDLTTDKQNLVLTLDEVSVAAVSKTPIDIQKSIESSPKNTLICPAGITNVQLKIDASGSPFKNDVLENIATTDAAEGIGFKVKAAFGEELIPTSAWLDFSANPTFNATPDKEGKIAVNFGANYVLTSDRLTATAGEVIAELPFKIAYN